MTEDKDTREAERQRIREAYLRPSGERPDSSARGIHHTALISSDVERTVHFYQELLEFPLTEVIENRLEQYHEKTEPLVVYYKGKDILRRVDGGKDLDEVSDEIRRELTTAKAEDEV